MKLIIVCSVYISRNDAEPDKLFKVHPLFDDLATRFKSAYNPEKELSVDESMVPWRGRLSFPMFIVPSKPTRYSIKICCCCEADSGCVLPDAGVHWCSTEQP